MDAVYLTWTWRNWITVILMAAIGFMALAALSQFYKNSQAKKGN